MLHHSPKGHRFPAFIISHCIWLYHRFSLSYRDIEELMFSRGVHVSCESIRRWCKKFSRYVTKTLRKKEAIRGEKWHLDEMTIKIQGEAYVLWRAVDSQGYELDMFIQKRRNKKAALRFLKRLLGVHPTPRVIVTDKLKSYIKPIRMLCSNTAHRCHKRLNNRAENSHLSIRCREKSWIKMKSVFTAQTALSLMGATRNLFAVNVGRYQNPAWLRKFKLKQAFVQWDSAFSEMLVA